EVIDVSSKLAAKPETCIAEWSKRRRTHLAGETYVVSSREHEHRHQADHVDQNRRDFDAFYVDCDPDDLHADEPQTDADRMHDAIGDDFSAIVIPADLPRTYVG